MVGVTARILVFVFQAIRSTGAKIKPHCIVTLLCVNCNDQGRSLEVHPIFPLELCPCLELLEVYQGDSRRLLTYSCGPLLARKSLNKNVLRTSLARVARPDRIPACHLSLAESFDIYIYIIYVLPK